MSSLDQLTSQQEDVGKEICTLARNYAKDGADRKTANYLKVRLTKLSTLWETFDSVDSEIRDNYPLSVEHGYFTKGYYDEVRKIYESMKNDITKRCAEMNKDPAVDIPPKQQDQDPVGPTAVKPLAGHSKDLDVAAQKSSEINQLTKQSRFRLLCKIFSTSLNKWPVNLRETNPQQFNQKTKTLVGNWDEISDAYKRLGDDAMVSDIELYFELQDLLDSRITWLHSNQSTPNPCEQGNPTAIQLPKIEIPKFDGSYSNWPQFYDLYKQMVHDQPISPAQKLYFLKTNVTGDAKNLIQHFHATDSNYPLAWSTLVDRFNNNRLLLTAQLNRLFQHNVIGDNVKSLKRLHDTTKEVIQAINNLGYDTSGWDPIVVHLLLDKMDKDTRMLFEESLETPKNCPTLTMLLHFVEGRFQALEAVKPEERKKVVTTASEREVSKCLYCRANSHKIFNCTKFIHLSVEQRNQNVRKLRLCTICLKEHHSSSCQQQRRCKTCNGKHNTLLHYPPKKDTSPKPGESFLSDVDINKEIPSGSKTNNSLGVVRSGREVYLATAIVNLVSSNGVRVPCRAMLDSGSQLNFITASLAQQLGFKKQRRDIPISGIGGKESQSNFTIQTQIESRTSPYQKKIEACIMPTISDYVATSPFNMQSLNLPSNICLADPDTLNSRHIDVLIGAEIFFELLLPGEYKISNNLPLLRNTRLGWILAGTGSDVKNNWHCHSASKPTLSSLDKLVRSFWESDSLETESRVYTEEEYKCEKHFIDHIEITPKGQFMVRLPFKQEPNKALGNSMEMAKKRFYSLERKLEKNPEIKISYANFMNEYLSLGHMTSIEGLANSNYFLPHHCVFKPDSSSTKLRVVFDASAKTTSGNSLNDILMVGPTVQPDLFSVIVNFRLHKFVFTGDISKMYRQILVHPEDRAYQLILWRENNKNPLKTYQLNTVTYGTASASFLSTRCLVKLSSDFQYAYPNAFKVVTKNIYVDDCLAGAGTINEAKMLLDETRALLKKGNFDLTKFCSNGERILESIPVECREKTLTIYQSEVIKTLGLVWDPIQDVFKFCYKHKAMSNEHVTKRTVLADLAKFFDPLGLIGPVTLLGKIFLQELWKTKTAWDENLPLEQAYKWKDYMEKFSLLQEITIPRFVLLDPIVKLELHAFSDSSESAFGACIYLKSSDKIGNISVQLLCSKSRLVPLKAITIARLELQAAVLLVDLVKKSSPYNFQTNILYNLLHRLNNSFSMDKGTLLYLGNLHCKSCCKNSIIFRL